MAGTNHPARHWITINRAPARNGTPKAYQKFSSLSSGTDSSLIISVWKAFSTTGDETGNGFRESLSSDCFYRTGGS